ncbi:MAG: chromosome segregation protein SMC [Anaerolineae bacterium]|nr:chromosome segregation protein SMC [Anaerolineae bacterium]
MRIKRLSLQGYKTFATKTEFIFDMGITAVVGPNGSGKSNIADALRWVLGEQSYSTLRGKRTTDMIFAGSQSRARAGMAQSILTLDNSEGWLPIDYSEVEIGRRAYRSGENEYILNGQKVRLKDITDLLSTSGLAERTYTIIGQGLVDQALSLRSEERRALFEEAAGINHYKSRRAETLRRLQETQHNLQRIHDILAEIQPRLTSLKRQATRARNYEQIQADLHHLLRLWYGYKWEQAKKELRQVRDTAVTAETTWQQNRHKLRVRQENSDDLRRRLHRLEQQAADLQNERDDTRDQLETARRQAAIMGERRESLVRRLAEVEADLPGLEQQAAAAQAELTAALHDLAAAQTELQQSRGQWQQYNADFETTRREIDKWQTAVQQATQQQRDKQNRLAQAQGQINQLRERLKERAGEQNQADTDEVVKVQAEIERLMAVFQSAQQKNDDLRQQRDAIVNQRQTLIRDLKTQRQAHRDAEQQLQQRRRDLARLEARADMLDGLRLKEVAADKNGVIGALVNFITIPPAYEPAIAAAMQARLGALLLPDEKALWHVLAAQAGNSALSAIALNRIQLPELVEMPEDAGVIGWAAGLVSARPEAERAAELLLGQILLVQDAAAAYRIATHLPPGCTAVSLDGFIAHPGGLVETGSGQSSILARETEWRQAQAALVAEREKVGAVETAVTAQQTAIQQMQNQVDDLQNEETRLAWLLTEAGQEATRTQREMDRQRQQLGFVERQRQSQLQEVGRLEQRIGEIEMQIEVDTAELVSLEKRAAEAQVKLAVLPVTESQQQRDGLQQAVNAAQTIVAGRQAVVDSRRATLAQFSGQLVRLQERRTQLQQEQAALSQAAEEQERTRLFDQVADLEARLGPLKERLSEARLELAQMEEGTAVLQKVTHDAETLYTQSKIALTQHQTTLENLQERIKADLGLVALTYDEDQTGPTPLPIGGVEMLPVVTELPGDIESTIQEYRAQMHRMGAINPDAPEEYEATQERFDFMTQQVGDLNETEAQLRKIIAELDDLTSRAFAETVDKVNAVFGGIFTQLFGGGAARLVLTDPDDLTISGVDIIARLPNRREQALGLLSGGERSLTAVALIFSLLKVAPTPFCVLDEVDAALDEANINRFRELLQELSLKTQFIIITHNRGTVQAAQTIYGISMGTDSASQAISIKPEDYIKQPELI